MGDLRKQPRGLIRLSRTNPLAQAIEIAILPGMKQSLPFFVPNAGYTTPVLAGQGYAHSVQGSADMQAYPTGSTGNLDGTDFTICVIVDPIANADAGVKGLISKRDSTSSTGLWSLWVADTTLCFSHSPGDRLLGVVKVSDATNTMYSVTGSVSRTLLTGYQDAVQTGTAALGAIAQGNPSPIRLGVVRGNVLTQNFKGNYLLGVVWKRVLTAQEIHDFYINPYQIFEDPTEDEYDLAAIAPGDGRVPVYFDLQVDYAIRTTVNRSLIADYSVRATTGLNLVADYAVRSAVGIDLTADYSLLGSVAGISLTAEYAVRGSVGISLTSSAAVRGSVAKNLSADYSVRSSVACELVAGYSVAGAVKFDLLASYAILGVTTPTDVVVPPSRVVNFDAQGRTVTFDAVNNHSVEFVAQSRTVEFVAQSRIVEF